LDVRANPSIFRAVRARDALMIDGKPERKHLTLHLRGTLIAGLLTIAPVIAVWLVFDFLLNVLFEAGHPLASMLADYLDARAPSLRPWLTDDRIQYVVAVVAALAILYVIGVVASRVIGMRLIAAFESIIERLPVAEFIYSAAKKLVGVLKKRPSTDSRVVLIEFPHAGHHALGFVMHTFPDANTAEELAAVLVPTAPNPSTGYLQIVPVSRLLPTAMSMDEAMTMILSAGAATPGHISLAAAPRPPAGQT
jgi:uncharacterized membrane protein